jgi:hypothetical protein
LRTIANAARSVAALLLAGLLLGASQQNDLVQYVDVAAEAGLTKKNVCGNPIKKNYTLEVTGNGCAFFDYDRDGYQDILLIGGSTIEGIRKGGDPICALYHNDGNGHFTDVTGRAGLSAHGWGMGVTVADIDNDGWEDFYVTGYGSNFLYRNNGDGTFSDITKKAGVADGGWSTGCAFGDYDGDGFVDLFVVHYLQFDLNNMPEWGSRPYCYYRGIPVHCGPKGLAPETDRLYHNNGDGTFTDVSAKAGILPDRRYYGFTAVWTDYNDDGLLDIYVANDSTPNLLYRNNGNGTFTEVGLMAGVAVSEDGHEQAGMGIAVGDYNGDGLLDIFVTNFSDDYSTLYRHEPDHTFTDVSTRVGLGTPTWNNLKWGTGFIDFDNDGFPDLFSVNGHIYPEVDAYNFGARYRELNQIFRNLGNGKFQDLQEVAGPGFLTGRSSRGAAVGDYDNDGDPDIVVVNINDAPFLLENRGGNRRSWIGFQAEGTHANRSAVGSRIRVRAGERVWTQEVRSSGSYISHNDSRVLFGLGGLARIDSAEIRWPDGRVERAENLATNSYYRWKQGNSPERINMQPKAK